VSWQMRTTGTKFAGFELCPWAVIASFFDCSECRVSRTSACAATRQIMEIRTTLALMI